MKSWVPLPEPTLNKAGHGGVHLRSPSRAESRQGGTDPGTSWPVSLVYHLVSSRSVKDPVSNEAKQSKRNKRRWHLRNDARGCLCLQVCAHACTCTHECIPHSITVHKHIHPIIPRIIKRRKPRNM